MAHNPASELASTLQSASLNRNPDPAYDVNPATAASHKTPVHARRPSISSDILLTPAPRRTTLPPLPDLRFEQSYLARIAHATTWQQTAWITLLDHVLMPLSQGLVWNLALFGWRRWNSAAKFGGRGVGARVRRWWWGVNNWKLPQGS